MAHVHGRGSGVRLLAYDLDFVAAHVLNAGHDADGLGLLFEYRPLLDVRLKGCLDGLALAHALSGDARTRSSSASTLTPARSVSLSAAASGKRPDHTADPIIAIEKRLPSSLHQTQSSMGCRVFSS